MAVRTTGATNSSLVLVRTSRKRVAAAPTPCAKEVYSLGLYGHLSHFAHLKEPTTPTILIHGEDDPGGPNLIRLPTAAWFGKSRLAVSSSRMPTRSARASS